NARGISRLLASAPCTLCCRAEANERTIVKAAWISPARRGRGLAGEYAAPAVVFPLLEEVGRTAGEQRHDSWCQLRALAPHLFECRGLDQARPDFFANCDVEEASDAPHLLIEVRLEIAVVHHH